MHNIAIIDLSLPFLEAFGLGFGITLGWISARCLVDLIVWMVKEGLS